MDKIYITLSKYLGENRIKKDVLLSNFSSIRIGGRAKYFFEATSVADIKSAVKLAEQFKIPFFIIGGGTNLLISDMGFPGLIIKNKTNNIKVLGFKGRFKKLQSDIRDVFIEVDSGVSLNRLVRYSLELGLEGLQNFLGQPGSVGGALYINAHNVKNQDFFGNHIYQAKIISAVGIEKTVSDSYFKFGYDDSILQKKADIVLSAVLKLSKVADKDLLWQEAKDTSRYRQSSQPQGVLSSGCTFRNISQSDAMRLATPNFTKSAGYLIDRAGLKGKTIDRVQISPIHANFIINLGGASASSMLELINLVKRKVKNKFGVILKEEIVLVGFSKDELVY